MTTNYRIDEYPKGISILRLDASMPGEDLHIPYDQILTVQGMLAEYAAKNNHKLMAAYLKGRLDEEDGHYLSDCCAAGPVNDCGICPKCGEHCGWENENGDEL